jgi:putative mRNA 3-end processing factor
MRPESWVRPTPQGLYVEPGDFFIDPTRPAARAVITHGHSDHARPDHGAVLATPETLAIMRARMGEGRAGLTQQALALGEGVTIGGVGIRLLPAGHVLGSAQVVLDWKGSRAVVSGDYKRRHDPTCAGFEPIPCDVFVTEATFALPVFRHPDAAMEVARLLDSLRLFPDRAHLIGVYALGKAQRLIRLLREAGYDSLVAANWFGIVAPAKTPDSAVARLTSALDVALASGELQSAFRARGVDLIKQSPATFQRFIADEHARWSNTVANAKIDLN